jgi:Trk-type K+ transport system membrane component
MTHNWPWILGGIGFVIFFTIFEIRGFKNKNTTLSRFVYNMGKAFPLSIFLWGALVGGLAVHFFWHWCPPGSVTVGALPHITLQHIANLR